MYTEYCPCNSRQTNVNCVWRLKSLMFFIITPLTEDLLRTTEMFWTSNMFPDKLDDHLILMLQVHVVVSVMLHKFDLLLAIWSM